MSSSISAAKKRRANISQTQQQPPMQQPQQQQQQQSGAKPMSLPQVLKMFDSRIATLEKATKEAKPERSHCGKSNHFPRRDECY